MQAIVLRENRLIPEELLGYPAWMARLLQARGIETREQAEAFLHPCREQILPPLLLHDMAVARNLLLQAVAGKKRIVIYGDYDCDGVCACAILLDVLGQMGADVDCYIPDRETEGYGLNMQAAEKLAGQYDVMVTVDCGITSVQEVALAKEMGMTVIVTDHHTPGDVLPGADAVVSPLLGDYPFPGLCGAGVAWKLALALDAEKAEPLMELAALATVADMVPLLQENRALVKLGLEQMGKTERPGLKALMAVAGLEQGPDAQQVAFQLAPRINACGRMESARIALDLLCEKDIGKAMLLAKQAQELNERRKRLENGVVEEAQAQVAGMDLQDYHAIVVCGDGWNKGVVGLAAGKLSEQWGYPAVALARDGENYVGSARSASGVDIYAALKTCGDLFLRFGGHKQAAGMTLPAQKLEEFRLRLSDAVKAQRQGMAPRKQYICDSEMDFADITVENVERMNLLEPCGMGNPSPVFAAKHAKALNLRAVGAEGKHLQCEFLQGEQQRKGIFFGGGHWQGKDGVYALVFQLSLNVFREKTTAQMQLKYMAPEPECLRQDTAKEALAMAAAVRTAQPSAATVSEGEMDGLMQGSQGTLLVCRCLETALSLHRRYPQAVFAVEKADDPRAYHTILLYGMPHKACAPFRHVVLCDGELFEKAAWQQACPSAQVHVCREGAPVKQLFTAMKLEKDDLRACYRALMRQAPRDIVSFAEMAGVTRTQGAFALAVLREIELIEFETEPFRVRLLPMQKRDPEESALYQLIHRVLEA